MIEVASVDESIKKFQKESLPTGQDINYLKTKRKNLSTKIQACRLFQLRAKETLDVFKKLLKSKSKTEFLSKSPSIFTMLSSDYLSKLDFKSQLEKFNSLFKDSKSRRNFSIIIGLLLTISFVLMFAIRKSKFENRISNKTLRTLFDIIIRNIFFILFSFLYGIFVYIFIKNNPTTNMLQTTALIFFTYTCAAIVVDLIHAILIRITTYSERTNSITKYIKANIKFLGFVYVIYFVIHAGVAKGIIAQNLLVPLNFGLLTVLALLVGWTLKNVINMLKELGKKPFITKSMMFCLILFMIMVLPATVIGYHELSHYLLTRVTMSIVALFLYIPLLNTVIYLSSQTSQANTKIGDFIRHKAAVKSNKSLPEVQLLSFTFIAVLFLVLIAAMFYIWDAKFFGLKDIFTFFFEGFKVANLNLNPYKIIIALFVFGILMFVVRLISGHITHKSQYKRDRSTQNELASIVNYFGFTMALLIALLAAGVNFTGLAIIAGALSVGVGFGLQNIVNNFVSGLIVLIERPIKPGDRVIIGEVEGHVTRIRIRSTQIKTLAKEDVIVPNSDIITSQVTNLMFQDRTWRLECKVGVAYGSDTQLVTNVLLDVANSHPKVCHDAPNKPRVLFREFGDSALLFELWCIIEDVGAKNNIHSELNYAIDEAFRENNITIPFPQRDVHVKKN